jgi:hypothetical protein
VLELLAVATSVRVRGDWDGGGGAAPRAPLPK